MSIIKDSIIAKNTRIMYDYEVLHNYDAGIVLDSSEASIIRKRGNCRIESAYCVPNRGGLEVINMSIDGADNPNRTRALLLRRAEIKNIHKSVEIKGLTCVVKNLHYSATGYVKCTISVVRGKSKVDKRENIKQREVGRDIRRTLKHQQ